MWMRKVDYKNSQKRDETKMFKKSQHKHVVGQHRFNKL